jgi:hypothetical protein
MDANIVKATKQPSGSGHPRVVMGEITAVATRYRANYSIPMSNSESSKPRVVMAPEPSRPELRSNLLNVNCAEDEDVEWQWTETLAGRFVSGYRIVARVDPPV